MTDGINRVNMDFEACIDIGNKKNGIDRNGMTAYTVVRFLPKIAVTQPIEPLKLLTNRKRN